MGSVQPTEDFDKARSDSRLDGINKRAAPRYTLLIRAAKLVTRFGEFLCVIRDASDTGLSARIFHRIPACTDLVVELQNGERYEVEMVWQDEDRAGFRFKTPINVKAIIECPSSFDIRPVRLNMSAQARLVSPGEAEDVTIQDISQQGAKIACSGDYAIDQPVKLIASGMRDTIAKVRWRRDGTCGLVFEETFQFGELARIACNLQHSDEASGQKAE